MKEIKKQKESQFLDISEIISKGATIVFLVLGLLSVIAINYESTNTSFLLKLTEAIGSSAQILVLAFLSGGFWIAIHQLKFTNSNAKRNQVNETFAITKIYFDEIKPLINDVIKELEKKSSVIPFEWNLKTFSRNEVEAISPSWYKKFGKLKYPELIKMVDPLIRIESFAQLVVNADIDKKLAFNLMAADFASKVGKIMGFVAYLRSCENYPFCTTTIELFKEWGSSVDELMKGLDVPFMKIYYD